MWDKKKILFKYFNLKREDNIFSMWDKKNLLNFIIYNIYSLHLYGLFLNFFIWDIKTLNIFLFSRLTQVNPCDQGSDPLGGSTPESCLITMCFRFSQQEVLQYIFPPSSPSISLVNISMWISFKIMLNEISSHATP